jgi:probable HAF family extracellular repeat protein
VGINAERETIGNFADASGDVHGFVYWNGRLETFDTSTNGITYLRAINDIGQIVGNSGYASSLRGHAFLRQPNGTIVKLPNFEGGVFEAEAINNLGQIAGTVWLANPVPGAFFYVNHAVLMQAGGGAPRDLGSLGGPANASALNIWGQVVGYSAETYNFDPYGEPYFGVLYAGGKVINLGLPSDEVSIDNIFESYATGINDFGQIVGFSDLTYNGSDPHGLVYLNGEMYDLNDLIGTTTTYTITESLGINDFGQIVATALDAPETRTR